MIFTDVVIPKDASRLGWLKPNHRVEFTLVLSPKAALPDVHAALPPKNARAKTPTKARSISSPAHLTHAELRKTYGATAAGIELIESFARTFQLEVQEMHGRSIRLSGRAASVGRAFKTRFEEFERHGKKFFAPARSPSIPVEWDGAVEALLGLHSLPNARPHRRSMVHGRGTPGLLRDLAQAYAFPAGLDGAGETIGLIEFGGGFLPEDIEKFCSKMGSAAPKITVVKVGGGANRPSGRREVHEFLDAVNGALSLSAKAEQGDAFVAAQCTAEVTMDLEILCALAPGAHVVVYFASASEQELYRAISRAVHDEHHRPGILSISWGVPEREIPSAELQAIEGLLREAAHLGITVCASSGDAGALNGSTNRKPSVNYPASSPNCLACGGTSRKLDAAGVQKEVVWNSTHHGVKGASGGGVSEQFPLPTWQKDARVPTGALGQKGRGLPDVAGLADPRYGCELLIADRVFTSCGTSAVAPLWAALVARLNQALGRRCGHLHPHLYRMGKERKAALRPVLKGNNGFYEAGERWNACTGYGTPRGKELLAHLQR